MKRLTLLIILTLTVAVSVHAQKDFANRLSNAALELTSQHVAYDPAYFTIPYPNGDIPANKGVCTDVIIRDLPQAGE